jgi:hypothetical protein
LQPDGMWICEVTVRHEDTGWEHYAHRREVLATLALAHAHVDEQPEVHCRQRMPRAQPHGRRSRMSCSELSWQSLSTN